MKRILTLLMIATTIQAHAQQFCTELFGFRLGQYREAAKTELGKPFKIGKYSDGFEYEAFLLKPDTSLYIIFEYAVNKKDIIWSIQVSGSNSTTDIGFKNVKLGINKTQTEKLIGRPSSTENIGEYGNKWVYSKTNFSLEVSKAGKLSSVKILDNSQELFPAGPDPKKIPTFDVIRSTLNSNNNSDILKLLSGDIETYYKGSTYYFKKPFLAEQSSDYSKVLSIIKTISKDLSSVNTGNLDEYEENMRLTLGEDIKHVIKIKKGHLIKEIVLKYFGGQYYIFEINANTK
ncbi:hypothetical protein [Mucilaginibacter sp.]|uniref:hypothetical protein n=1 Tax=Mucilaginibacter sp. TaxID=1882438 RepID=UPI0026372ACE|nr:hypothetical protein [Mucilaginibacter sp.]MDB4924099.1 Pyruvate phosphate dikinase [Mucilaginibacter sp.]